MTIGISGRRFFSTSDGAGELDYAGIPSLGPWEGRDPSTSPATVALLRHVCGRRLRDENFGPVKYRSISLEYNQEWTMQGGLNHTTIPEVIAVSVS